MKLTTKQIKTRAIELLPSRALGIEICWLAWPFVAVG